MRWPDRRRLPARATPLTGNGVCVSLGFPCLRFSWLAIPRFLLTSALPGIHPPSYRSPCRSIPFVPVVRALIDGDDASRDDRPGGLPRRFQAVPGRPDHGTASTGCPPGSFRSRHGRLYRSTPDTRHPWASPIQVTHPMDSTEDDGKRRLFTAPSCRGNNRRLPVGCRRSTMGYPSGHVIQVNWGHTAAVPGARQAHRDPDE